MKGYLANGLFTIGDCLVNEIIAKEIRNKIKDIDLYVPQENDSINDKNSFADSITIFKADTEKLLESDFLIAVIDGAEIDSGVASELGIFSTTGKPIYALYTDIRQLGRDNNKKIQALIEDSTENQFMYKNLFVVGLIKENGYIFNDISKMVLKIKEDLYRNN